MNKKDLNYEQQIAELHAPKTIKLRMGEINYNKRSSTCYISMVA